MKIIINNKSSFSSKVACEIVGLVSEIEKEDGNERFLQIYSIGLKRVAVSLKINKSSETYTLFDYKNDTSLL
jgi:hypothetical protein